jgi:hypothetical protein
VVTGDILGTITDPSGAALPNAKIVIRNTGTHETHTVQSGSSGEYILPALPSGYYSITVMATNFKTAVVKDVKLDVGSRLRQDFNMALGESSQTVQVLGETPALVTDTATLSGFMGQQRVEDLPLDGRNFFQLADLAPGANEGPAALPLASGTRPDDRRQWASVSAFAQSDTLNNIMVDGLDNNEKSIGSTGIRPAVEAIAEFQVQTNVYPAEVGKTPGAVVNVITKSGTNDFHGALYEFVRNSEFDAVNFFTRPGANAEYRQNQFGGGFGRTDSQEQDLLLRRLRWIAGCPGGSVCQHRTNAVRGEESWKFDRHRGAGPANQPAKSDRTEILRTISRAEPAGHEPQLCLQPEPNADQRRVRHARGSEFFG